MDTKNIALLFVLAVILTAGIIIPLYIIIKCYKYIIAIKNSPIYTVSRCKDGLEYIDLFSGLKTAYIFIHNNKNNDSKYSFDMITLHKRDGTVLETYYHLNDN